MIHFMLFDLLYLILFIFMQDVPPKLLFILLEHFDVIHTIMEVRRYKFIEI